MSKFKVGDKAIKTKGYKFPCTIVSVFETAEGNVRVVGEMDEYGLLHIFNEDQLELVTEFPSYMFNIYLFVDDTGIEPVTPTMSMWCSTAEPIVLFGIKF